MLSLKNYEYQSDFARKYYGQGLAKGESRGLLTGKAEAVVTVLRARGLRVTKAQQALITGCTDLAQLERWLTGAVSVRSAAALLDGGVEPAGARRAAR